MCISTPSYVMTLFIDSSCERFWESNQELRACYQFNLYTILTWSQALSTCQAQGGNLLSITSLAEHRYIRGRHLLDDAIQRCRMKHATFALTFRNSTAVQSDVDVTLAQWDTGTTLILSSNPHFVPFSIIYGTI